MVRSICIALAFTSAASFAHAEYITQTVTLDQSNKFSDGVKYGSVTIEAYNGVGAAGGGLAAGQVRLTYAADNLASYGNVLFFGINAVGFNTDLSLKSSQIKGPKGWVLGQDDPLDGFGNFAWKDHSFLGIDRKNPVTLLITGLGADATLDHFLLGSHLTGGGTPPQGSSTFAAHVGGIGLKDSTFEGHWIGDSFLAAASADVSATPEPGTLMLAGSALGGLGLAGWMRRGRCSRRLQPTTSAG